MSNINISEELFFDLVKYFFLNDDSKVKEINERLNDKLDRLAAREAYTNYKTLADPVEKEVARKKYLDAKGIPEDYRW